MEKTLCVCPSCQEIKKNADNSIDLSYHTNQSNFKNLNVNIGDNMGMLPTGGSNKNYNIKICNTCYTSTEPTNKVKQLITLLDELKAADETLKTQY